MTGGGIERLGNAVEQDEEAEMIKCMVVGARMLVAELRRQSSALKNVGALQS